MRLPMVVATVLTAAAVAVPSLTHAQQRVAVVYMVKPQPGHEMQFQEALAAHAQWRRDNNDPWGWSVAQVAAGSDLGMWYIRSAGHLWNDFDEYNEGFAQAATEHWFTNVGPHVAHVSSVVTTHDTTNVRWPEDPSSTRFVLLIDFSLKPGHQQQFFEAVGKFHDAIVQTDYPAFYSFNWSVAGGPGEVITLALPYESWGSMAPPERPMAAMIAEVYGPEEAQALNERFSATLRHSESTLLMLRPDLSVNLGM